jgi:hypothetical protein
LIISCCGGADTTADPGVDETTGAEIDTGTDATTAGTSTSTTSESTSEMSTGSESSGTSESSTGGVDLCSASPTIQILGVSEGHRHVFAVFADDDGWVVMHGPEDTGGLDFSRPDGESVHRPEIDGVSAAAIEPMGDGYLLCWDERCLQLDAAFEPTSAVQNVPHERPRDIMRFEEQLFIIAGRDVVPIDELGQPEGDGWTIDAHVALGVAESGLVGATQRDPECGTYPEPTPKHCRVEARVYRANGVVLSPWVDVGPYDDTGGIEYSLATAGDRFLAVHQREEATEVSVFTVDGEPVGESTLAVDYLWTPTAYGVPQGFVLAGVLDARLVLLDRDGGQLSEAMPLVVSDFYDATIPVIGVASGAWAAAWAEHRPIGTDGVYIRAFGCAWP